MTAQIISTAELVEYGSRSIPMDGFAEAQLVEAVARATDRIRQAALNVYTPESFELLTVANSPDEMRDNAFVIALSRLTRGDAARPSSIDEAMAEAKMWLGFLAGGTTHYDKSPNAVLVRISSSFVSSNAATRQFDRKTSTGDCTPYGRHDPELP